MAKPPSQTAAAYKEPDFEKVLAKPMSPMIEHFHSWVLDKTGYNPANAKTKAEAFAEGIRLGTALRGVHQASPENQERLAASRQAAEEPTPAPAKAAKAAPAKRGGKAAAPAAPPAEAPPATQRPPAKKATRGRAAAKTSTTVVDEAPF